jgi:glycosyltransferase involved in cell wall biosynthesis
MRIALVVHKFPPASLGGTETYTHNLARALAKDHEVFVFYRDDGNGCAFREEWEEREGFRAWHMERAFDTEQASPIALFFDTFFNRDVEASFKRFLTEVQADIVHFQHLMLLSYRLIAQTKRLGLPCLLTLHDYWFLCANSQLIRPNAQICQRKPLSLNCARCATVRINKLWLRPLFPIIALVFKIRDALVQRAALKADLLISPSQFLSKQYVTAGFPTDRLRQLENGIDVERIQAFSRKPLVGDRIRITYLGSLAWQKGIHTLIQATNQLPPDRVHLRIIGNPNTFPDYASSLQRMANPALVSFEGQLPNNLVGQALVETDVLAVPSLWYENSPVVIQEAFAARVPVIASNLGALSEKVHHEVNGLLAPPGDIDAWRKTLERLVQEPDLLEQFRRRIPPVMTAREHVHQLGAIYRKLAQPQGQLSLPLSRRNNR